MILYLRSFYFHSSLDSRLDSQDLILNSFNTACGHMQAGVWVHEMFIFPALTFQKHSNLVRSNTARPYRLPMLCTLSLSACLCGLNSLQSKK